MFRPEDEQAVATVDPEIRPDEESGEVESAEWELAEGRSAETEAFPSGVKLPPGTGATGRDDEHWDPNGVSLPLYATGPQARRLRLSANFTVGELVSSGGQAADVARISPDLVRCLQGLRDRVGKPVRVSSGYRVLGAQRGRLPGA